MSLFKRLSATFVSRIDQVVGEIENHEAVIQASLTEMNKKVVGAKVRLTQVRKEGQRIQQQILQQQENAKLWRQRAVNNAKEDEGKALDCLSHARLCEHKTEKLQEARKQYNATADKLAEDIETSEQRLGETKQKLTLMRARHSTNQALSATNKANENAEDLLEESFERWEISIGETELSFNEMDSSDSLERDFLAKEKQEELRNELASLLTQEEQK